MSTNDTTPPIRESRSLHNLLSGFFFNHGVDHSRAAGHAAPIREGVEHEGVGTNSNAVALVFGKQFELDDFKLLESTADVTSAASSSPMRRSETWTSSLKKSYSLPEADSPPSPPSSSSSSLTPLPNVQSTSGMISFTASGGGGNTAATGSGLGALRKSITDIFSPDARDTPSSLIPTAGSTTLSGPDHDRPTPALLSKPRHSLPALHGDAGGHALPGAEFSSPVSPKSKSMIRRQTTLPALIESEPSSEFQSIQKFESQVVEKRTNLVDVNHNAVIPEGGTSGPTTQQKDHTRSPSLGEDAKMAAGDFTQPEAMKIPEVRSPRKFGILDLFAAGERRNVRNKDVNAMAPQSW